MLKVLHNQENLVHKLYYLENHQILLEDYLN